MSTDDNCDKTLAEIARRHDTDKSASHAFITNFERHFSHLRDKPVRVLELGVLQGGSLLMWQEYFKHGLITGVDINQPARTELPDRVRFYQGSQTDKALLARVATECAPHGFDIIIDDASHIGTLSRTTFQHLFDAHLKSGGIYVIEDWCGGYWPKWPDGAAYHDRTATTDDRGRSFSYRVFRRLMRSFVPKILRRDVDFNCHNFGMVGFVKELIDEVAWPDITDTTRGNPQLPRRNSRIAQMTVYVGQAFLTKS